MTKPARRGYGQDRRGAFTALGVSLLTLSVVAAGIAVDVARFETKRSELQYNLDRAVLAAASLRQTRTPQTIVEDYMGLVGVPASDVSITQSEVSSMQRRVSASVEVEIETFFLNMLGFHSYDVAVAASAAQAVPKIEVSLALDVSASMAGDRLDALIPAAQNFVTGLLSANADEDDATATTQEKNRAFINLVPYASLVSAGPALFNRVVSEKRHDNSYCLDLNNTSEVDFSSAELDTIFSSVDGTTSYDQVGHFSIFGDSKPIDEVWCPSDSSRHIIVGSKDATAINTQIGNFFAEGNTSIDMAMKWAVALLDPSMNAVFTDLNQMVAEDADYTATQVVSDGFLDRPSAYNDAENTKVIVLMTDGENWQFYNLKDAYISDTVDPNIGYDPGSYTMGWNLNGDHDVEDNSLDLTQWTGYIYKSEGGQWFEYGFYPEYYYNGNDYCYFQGYQSLFEATYGFVPCSEEDSYTPEPVVIPEYSWNDIWADISYLDFQSYVDSSSSYTTYLETTNSQTKDTRLSTMCQTAKDNNILIFTIAFSAPEAGRLAMEDCATSEAYYYDADTDNLDEVFGKILSNIQKLKLVD